MSKKILLIMAAGLFIFGISKLSFAMMCGEHSEQKQLAQAHSGHGHGKTEAVQGAAPSEEAVNVGNKICPVSGEKIDEKTKTTYEYEGKTYNFCCAECIDEFKKDPAKYIKKVDEELQAESKGQSKKSEEHDMGMMQGTGTSDQGMHGGHHH